MVIHLMAWLYVALTIEVLPFFWDILDGTIFQNRTFLFMVFIFLYIWNAFVCSWTEPFNNNLDMLYKFASFCFRAVSIFITLLFAEFKKFFYHLKNFKYKESIDTFLKLVELKLSPLFVIWRPLFRKWSYFGFFKTNRSKWWKNK